MIPYGKQWISDEDVRAVVDTLRSDFLTQGPMVPRFEQAIADYCGVGHAVAVNSATSALHVACLALDVGPGDRVWTSPNTFVASANCARYCGAAVDFVDIDPLTFNMSAEALEEKLRVAARTNALPKVVIPVHFAGEPCDMVAIGELARHYGFRVIEDASHAVGSRYRETRIGDCAHSDVVVFSFHPVKIITSAEGGMAMTRDRRLADRMSRLRSHGITRNPSEMSGVPHGPWYYEQVELGLNYRLTDVQAALGLTQSARIDPWIARRQELARQYDAALENLPLSRQQRSPESLSALHLYVIQVLDTAPLDRAEAFARLRESQIGVNVHYIPVHLQPDYRRLGFGTGMFPIAEDYYRRAISIPMYAALSDDDQNRVIDALRSIFS